MSTPHLERELTAVLRKHAEDAMSRTDTQAELLQFHADVEKGSGPARRRQVFGRPLIAAAAAAAAFALWTVNLDDDRTTPRPDTATPPQTAEEELAQRVVEAFTARDARGVASFLAPGAKLWDGWRGEMRRDEAWDREYIVEQCRELGSSEQGTEVSCDFAYHLWHSEQMGLGPFRENYFVITVDDGNVVAARASYGYVHNGQGDLFDDIGVWVRQQHPGDWEFMADTEGHTPADMKRWRRLWDQYSEEYAEARSQQS